jgi:hypothetical protein
VCHGGRYSERQTAGNRRPLPTLLRRWQSLTVRALAVGIETEGAYDRMPILADALEDAGCDNFEVLNHCRGPGPHVSGCWALDLVRGRD